MGRRRLDLEKNFANAGKTGHQKIVVASLNLKKPGKKDGRVRTDLTLKRGATNTRENSYISKLGEKKRRRARVVPEG